MIIAINTPCNLLAQTEFNKTEITLPITADFVKILSGGKEVLLIANKERKIVRYDLEKQVTVKSTDLTHNATDLAITFDGNYAYVVGPGAGEKDGGVISRLDLKNDVIRTISLSDRLVQPKIAVDADGIIFIGDQGSNVVKAVVPAESFDQGAAPEVVDAGHSDDLKRAVGSIGVTWDGKFLFVSHIGISAISMIDGKIGQWLHTLDTSVSTKSGILVVADDYRPKDTSRASVLLVTGDTLLVYDLDRKFKNLDLVQNVPVGLGAQVEVSSARELVSSDSGQHLIILGNRGSKRLVIFNRQGRIIERRSEINLPMEAVYVDVSPEGDLAVVLDNRRNALAVIRRPEGSANCPAQGDELRTAQRILATLGYPIGAVDGIDGPQTRRAIKLFQEKAGSKSTGILDGATLLALHEGEIQALQDVLKKTSRESDPLSWAIIQRRLGRSLTTVSDQRVAKTDRLEAAVASLGGALEVFEAENISDFVAARTKQDLACAQHLLKERESAEKGK
jgi:DNA-binding beta-propeller fold protein YncE